MASNNEGKNDGSNEGMRIMVSSNQAICHDDHLLVFQGGFLFGNIDEKGKLDNETLHEEVSTL